MIEFTVPAVNAMAILSEQCIQMRYPECVSPSFSKVAQLAYHISRFSGAGRLRINEAGYSRDSFGT